MVNPFHLFSVRQIARRANHVARRLKVPVPTTDDSESAVFLVLRRMRRPLLLILVAFSFSVAGLTLMPGQNHLGETYHLTFFEAFYVISYTATTIGFGEVPYPFTLAQRMWVTGSIYVTVVTWAYAIGVMFSILQDSAFQDTISSVRFRRRVRSLQERFVIICGYGQSGARVGQGLDEAGYRFVAIDTDARKVEEIVTVSGLTQEVPGLSADASVPANLGQAGLGHPKCAAVLALTDDDTTNLGIVMASKLLRPEVPVVARCHHAETESYMHDFGVNEVINPNDRYGAYLLLRKQRPETHRLLSWLLSSVGTPIPEPDEMQAGESWMIAGEGTFAEELAADLQGAGEQVQRVPAHAHLPDLSDVTGFVAATNSDPLNLALAEHARSLRSNLFVAARQRNAHFAPLSKALALDSVFVPTDLVAREALARIVNPQFRAFTEITIARDNEWAGEITQQLLDTCGPANPRREFIKIDSASAPAVMRWLKLGRSLTVGDFLRHPDDRDQRLPKVVLLLTREDGKHELMPGPEVTLRAGDSLLVASKASTVGTLSEAMFYDAVLSYLVDDEIVPNTWLWRILARRRSARAKTLQTDSN